LNAHIGFCVLCSEPQLQLFLSASSITCYTDLLVDELLQDAAEDIYVDDSDDDLMEWQQEEMDKDEELSSIMASVFGPESDEECP
jgi:hypothetical protein